MNFHGEFVTTLDAGVLGELDVVVNYQAYKAEHRAPDDYDEMVINYVTADFSGKIIDVMHLMHDVTMEDLRERAWGDCPSREDYMAHLAEERYERFREERALYREIA